MGSSVLLIFAFPLMIIGTLFNLITGAIFGYPTVQVELPYDDAKGIVWEYDNVDDPYIMLVDTKIENDKQIFVFEGTNKSDNDYCGRIMELVFTDKNGNEKVYYGYHASKLYAPEIYPAEECQLTEITLTAHEPVSGGIWKVTDNDYYILCEKASVSETQIFTTVITPFNKKGEYNVYGKFDVKFAYTNSFGLPLENATVVYEFKDGKHFISEIKH